MKIDEHIKLDDNWTNAPKGVIRIYNEKGELVAEKCNMIVEKGRYLLYELFKNYVIKNIDPNTTSGTGYQNPNSTIRVNFSYLTDPVRTSSDLKLSDISTALSGIETAKPEIDFSDSDMKFTLKTTVKGSETFKKFNQIYLTYMTGVTDSSTPWSQDNAILFSRVAMDPVFLGADGFYSLYYSIYF